MPCDSKGVGNVTVACDFYRIGNGVKVPRLTGLLGKNRTIGYVEHTWCTVQLENGKHRRDGYDIFYATARSKKRRLRYNIVILRREGAMYRDVEDMHAGDVREAFR